MVGTVLNSKFPFLIKFRYPSTCNMLPNYDKGPESFGFGAQGLRQTGSSATALDFRGNALSTLLRLAQKCPHVSGEEWGSGGLGFTG